MKIIDTHVHIWDFEKASYKWLEGDTSILNRTYSIGELEPERKAAGITEGVLVQAANNFEDTDWMLQVAAQNPWISGVVGWLPLADPQATARAWEQYGKNPYFKGVRHLIHNEKDPAWLLQPEVLESLRFLAGKNIPYDVVGIHPQHLETALKVAGAVPDLNMVLDHINQPPISAGERFGRWGELLQEAAAHPRFYAKISGLGTTAGKGVHWQVSDLEPYIGYTLEQFGEERCFCGGDWPVSLLAGNYSRIWNAYKEILSRMLNKEALEKVWSGNAEKFYNLNRPE